MNNKALYDLAMHLAPHGIYGDDFIPIAVDGNALCLRFFQRSGKSQIEFGLYVAGKAYSRKTFVVAADGAVHWDEEGSVPVFDLGTKEPRFTSNESDIIKAVFDCLQQRSK